MAEAPHIKWFSIPPSLLFRNKWGLFVLLVVLTLILLTWRKWWAPNNASR